MGYKIKRRSKISQLLGFRDLNIEANKNILDFAIASKLLFTES